MTVMGRLMLKGMIEMRAYVGEFEGKHCFVYADNAAKGVSQIAEKFKTKSIKNLHLWEYRGTEKIMIL